MQIERFMIQSSWWGENFIKCSTIEGYDEILKEGKVEAEVYWSFKIVERISQGVLRIGFSTWLIGFSPYISYFDFKKYHQDNFHVTQMNLVLLDQNLTFKDKLGTDLGRQIQKLTSKEIDSVKVQSKF